MFNAIFRSLLGAFLAALAFLLLPLLYTGVPSRVQFHHGVTVLDLPYGTTLPSGTQFAADLCRSPLWRIAACLCVVTLMFGSELLAWRSGSERQRATYQQVTHISFLICLWFAYILTWGVIQILVTI